MTAAYALFGHRIVSPCALWGLATADRIDADAPVITVSLDRDAVVGGEQPGDGSTAYRTPQGEDGRLSLQRHGDDGFTVFINEGGVTRARIDHDLATGSIAFREAGPIDPVQVTSFLVSPFMPLRLRTLMRAFPLHAAVIAIGDRAVAICGPSGAGKTTLALYLRGRSHAIVADDLAAIDVATGLVHHGAAFCRIDPNHPAARQARGARRANPRVPKHFLDIGDHDFWLRPRALPLAAIFILGSAGDGAIAAERIDHPYAGLGLSGNLSGELFAPSRAARQRGLAAAFDLARRVPVYALRRPRGLEHLGATADAICDIAGARR